jgi:hypothetical protein
MSHDDDAQRRASYLRQEQREIEVFTHSTGFFEVRFDMNVGKAVPIAQNQLGVIDPELLRVPILNQTIEHVEVVREVDDAGWIAVGKPNWYRARERTLRRNELTFIHCDLSLGTRPKVE